MEATEQNTAGLDASDQVDFFDVKHLEADIRGHSIRGGAVTLFAQGARVFLMFAGFVVLARLLSPKDFGLLAMVTSVTAFAVIFKDMGLSTATVQKSEINHGQISVLFWVNTCIGFLTMLVVAVIAPFISRFYGESRLTYITLVLSITFFLGGLSIQHQALLRRQMRFGTLASIQILSMLVSIISGIIFALCGAGYWALVFMQLAMSGTTTIGLMTFCRWRPGLPVRRSGVRSMLRFGGHITGFSIINYFSHNLDKILIGRFCGDGMLGLYSESYRIIYTPISNLRSPMTAVAIPALSRLQNDPDRYKRFYSQMLMVLALISIPVLVFLCACSENVILLVLGEQWVAMNWIFKMLAVAGLMQTTAGTRGLVLISCGQTGRYLKWGIIGSATTICAIAIGIPWGALGVATALAITWNL
ncbi:MAG: lipopolysaccharide biosynthesis protein, partial [Pirellulales bacterium]|nr:lipopolysaccharide biosynthesis protein [Pirellulales bacterium]